MDNLYAVERSWSVRQPAGKKAAKRKVAKKKRPAKKVSTKVRDLPLAPHDEAGAVVSPPGKPSEMPAPLTRQ